jgi:hypothetical protein
MYIVLCKIRGMRDEIIVSNIDIIDTVRLR